MTAMLLFFLALGPAPAPPVVKGTLCLSPLKSVVTEGRCRSTSGTVFAIEPRAEDRLFVWSSDDGRVVAAGVAKAGSDRVDLDEATPSRVNLAIRGSRRWPADTRLELKGEREWRWTIGARQVDRLTELRLAPARYAIAAGAEHHVRVQRRFEAAKDEISAGVLKMDAIPQARGRVVDPKQKAIAGALITLVTYSEQKSCTTAELDGGFECELLPGGRSILVSAGGFGTREVALGENDQDLGVIELQPGATLNLKIRRPKGAPQALTATLYHDDPAAHEHAKVQTLQIAASENGARFNDVAYGQYLILVSGAGPLERLVVPAQVGEKSDDAEAVIEPFQLEVSVLFGEEPLRDGTLLIADRKQVYRAELPLDPEGKFAATMWTHGRAVASVRMPGLGMPEPVDSPDLGTDPSTWPISIRRREISGHVIDAETKQPLPDTRIRVRTDVRQATPEGFSTMRAYFEVKADQLGAFRLLATRAGTYQLSVEDPKFVPIPVEVQIGAEDASRSVDLILQRGVSQVIRARWPDGSPVRFASILEGVASDGYNPEQMYRLQNGEASIAGGPRAARTLYILPQEGSLAVVHLLMPPSRDEMKPLDVVVPAATASLRVRGLDDSGKAAYPGLLLFRWNGELLPYMVSSRAFPGTMPGSEQGRERIVTGLPAGVYEVFVLRVPQDERAIMAGGVKPAAAVGLSTGEQSVTVEAPKGLGAP